MLLKLCCLFGPLLLFNRPLQFSDLSISPRVHAYAKLFVALATSNAWRHWEKLWHVFSPWDRTGLQDANVFWMEYGNVTQKRTAFISVKKKMWLKKKSFNLNKSSVTLQYQWRGESCNTRYSGCLKTGQTKKSTSASLVFSSRRPENPPSN